MKNLVIALVTTLTTALAFTNLGLSTAAQASDRSENSPISKECSAILTNAQYAKTLSGLLAQAKKTRHGITITGCTVLHIDTATFVYINLVSTLIGGDAPPMPFGSMVAEVKYSRTSAEPMVATAFFEPAATPPGGASVGN